MTDIVWPIDLIPASVEWRLIDNVSVSQSPFSGAVRRVSRPGTRWAARLTFPPMNGANRHRVMALIASLRGRANSLYMPDVSTAPRGSMAAPELFANANMSSTTGWSVQSGTLSARNGALRVAANAPSGSVLEIFQQPAVTQYAPYALRSLFKLDANLASLSAGAALSDGVSQDQLYTTSRGLITVSRVCLSAASSQYSLVLNASSGYVAGAWAEQQYASSARCLLVDNGPNATLYSDQIDNAAWTKNSTTVTANASTAADNTATADNVLEVAATTVHYVLQGATKAATAQDWAFGFEVKSINGRDCYVQLDDGAGSNLTTCVVNLTTGVVSGLNSAGTFSNHRAYVTALGNGWFDVTVIATTNTSTTVRGVVYSYNGSTTNFLGDVTKGIALRRAGLAQSSAATRRALTTSTAAATGALQTGSGLYIKGGPASTQGLRAAGDMVEVLLSSPTEITKSQMVRLTADLDTDASGRGYMQFEPALRSSPADSAAIIVTNPLSRMMVAGQEQGWQTTPGMFSDFTLDLVEDLA